MQITSNIETHFHEYLYNCQNSVRLYVLADLVIKDITSYYSTYEYYRPGQFGWKVGYSTQ